MVTPYQLNYIPWWSHQMETFSALLAICAWNSPAIGEFPAQRLVTQSFDIFFDLRLNTRLSERWWGWWFETPSCPLWRHCNDRLITINWLQIAFWSVVSMMIIYTIKLWVLIYKVHPTNHRYADICAIHPKNYENKYTTIQCTKLYCPRFGLSTFWFVDVLVCRRFGLSMFWYVDVLVCRRFSLSTFWSADVSVCRRFGLPMFWLSTFRFVDVLTSYLQKDPLEQIKAWLQMWSSFCRRHIQMDFFIFL